MKAIRVLVSQELLRALVDLPRDSVIVASEIDPTTAALALTIHYPALGDVPEGERIPIVTLDRIKAERTTVS
jgi:hypothetical protein